MLRLTARRHIKPYLHAFSPGARASEKGMLYRNGYMNAHAQVSSLQPVQRTNRERAIFMMLLIPEQVMAFMMILGAIATVVVLTLRQQPYSANTVKDRWLAGGMNQHEQFERNATMDQIFDMHKQAVENTRAELTRPVVFSPPEGYQSRSGVFSA